MSVIEAPERSVRSARAAGIVAAALRILEREGPDALTMRRLADDVGLQVSSLYKHFPDKSALEAALVEEALVVMGTALHAAVDHPGRKQPITALVERYRNTARSQPHLYRLATAGTLPRHLLPEGLEEWAGRPFFLAAGDPHLAQALWSFAHGMVILELDGRYPPGSDLDRTWRAGVRAFAAHD